MKKHLVWIILLLILVALYLLVEHRESLMVSPKTVDNFLGVDTTEVSKIEISKFGSSMTLSRAGGNWYIMEGEEPKKADKNAIKQLIDIVGGMKVGNVISDNPANQIKFQVDTLTGSTVSVYSGDRLLSAVVIGKMADMMHTYVRQLDEDKVYLAEGMMSHLFNRSPSDWRDKTIFDIDLSSVQGAEIQFGDQFYLIERADTVWNLYESGSETPTPADQQSLENLMTSLCGLRAVGFATDYDTTQYDFSNIRYTAKIKLLDGSEHLLEAASTGEDVSRHFVRIPEDSSVFIVNDPTWEKIAVDLQDLLPDEKNS